MISANVIQRTFHLRYNGSTGTCFFIDVDNRQYLITAKHILPDFNYVGDIELNSDKHWQRVSVKLVGHSAYADISVFALPFILTRSTNVIADSNSIIYGQDLYFLGFPYAMQSDVGELNYGLPMPLVKKGIVSCFLFDQPGKLLLLDGYNNPGFSGGPVVYRCTEDGLLRLAGIISGYRFDTAYARQNDIAINIQYQTNTGIIYSWGIDAALELINNNPIGPIVNG